MSRWVMTCPHCMVEGQAEKPVSYYSEQLHPNHAAQSYTEILLARVKT